MTENLKFKQNTRKYVINHVVQFIITLLKEWNGMIYIYTQVPIKMHYLEREKCKPFDLFFLLVIALFKIFIICSLIFFEKCKPVYPIYKYTTTTCYQKKVYNYYYIGQEKALTMMVKRGRYAFGGIYKWGLTYTTRIGLFFFGKAE